MDYYWLIPSTGKDIGGSSSQVKEMSNGYNLYADNSVWNIPIFKKMNFKPNLDSFVLYHKAKLTDIIFDIGLLKSTGFLLNNKVKLILESFLLPKHVFYPATVIHREKKYDYFWLQITEDLTNTIDLQKTTFSLKENIGWQEWIEIEKDLGFKNVDELIFKYKNKGTFNDLIPVKLNTQSSYDLYSFNYFPNSLLISEKLKKALENQEIKGYEVETLI